MPVLSASERALVTVVPHTTALRGSKFEVSVSMKVLKAGAFDAQNLISIPRAKLIRLLGALSPTEFDRVAHAIRDWLGL